MYRKTDIIKKEFFSILPGAFFSTLATYVCGLINSIIAGNYLGSKALASIGLTSPITLIVSAIALLIAVGSSNICGICLGKTEKEKADEYYSTSVIVILIVGAIITIISLLFSLPISRLLGANQDLENDTSLFTIGYAISFIPTILNQSLCTYEYMSGKQKTVVTATTIQIVLNILLNLFFFIFIDKHIFYAGLSTSIASIAETVYLLIANRKTELIVKFNARLFNIKNIAIIVKYGISIFFINIFIAVRNIAINYFLIISMGSMGTVAVSAWAIMVNACVILDAVADSTIKSSTTLFSISIGEKNKQAIKRIWTVLCTYGIIIFTVFDSLFILLSDKIPLLFNASSDETRYAQIFIIFYGTYLAFCIIGETLLGLLETLGEGKISVAFSFLIYCAFPILFSYILIKFIDCVGVIIAINIGYISAILIYFFFVWYYNNEIPKDLGKFLLIDKKINETDSVMGSIKEINEATDFSLKLNDFCIKYGIDKRRTYLISLACEEMTVNVINHGFTKMKNKNKGLIEVFATVEDNEVIVRIRDNAVVFNPLERLKLIEQNEDNFKNLGIKLVTKISKEMKYQTLIGRNVLTIKM